MSGKVPWEAGNVMRAVQSRTKQDRVLRAVVYAHWAIPLCVGFVPLFAAIVAAVSVGHWPRPFDGPIGINAIVDGARMAWIVLLVAQYATVPTALLSTGTLFFRSHGIKGAVLAGCAYVTLWLLIFLYTRQDPWGLADWIFD